MQKPPQSLKLDHLFAITDHNAVLQHSKFSVPAKREGYTVDDNARALVLAVKAPKTWTDRRLLELQRKLLSFLLLMQEDDGRFHNLMNFSQQFIDTASVGDHLGRAIWAAGAIINSDTSQGMRDSARLIFDRALPWARKTKSSRTKAYACLGLGERLHAEPHDANLKTNLMGICNSLVALYNTNRSSEWDWFEDTLTYDNARLSQALFVGYQSLGVHEYLSLAEESLQFLDEAMTVNGVCVPVGSNGWYRKGGERPMYDQQPIEVGAMIETCALAYHLRRSQQHQEMLRKAFSWFYGLNTKSVTLIDDSNGACYDGINEMGLNKNQGAESTIAFLLAVVAYESTNQADNVHKALQSNVNH